MQQGLHFGIAAWIHERDGSDGAVAFPTVPMAFSLRHFSHLESPRDLTLATEFALLANRGGQHAWRFDAGGSPPRLWELLPAIYADMQFALVPLTDEQRAELARADSVLFEDDGITVSTRYALYLEARELYQRLVRENADAAEVAAALSDWEVQGHKAAVEEALAVKTSLQRTSSRVNVQESRSRVEMALSSLGTSVPIAPTYFSPLSAESTDLWTEAEVDFDALEAALPGNLPATQWHRYRSRREGSVRFRFASVRILRPWLNQGIFDADDWRLPGAPLSAGDGLQGRLPALYSRLYLAQLIDVRVRPKPKPAPKPKLNVLATRLKPLTLSSRVRVRSAPPRVRTTVATARAMNPAGPPGVRRGAALTTARAQRVKVTATARPAPLLKGGSALLLKPHLRLQQAGRLSLIQQLTGTQATQRLELAKAVLNKRPTAAPAQPAATYFVAMGRSPVPACPNPNPNYQWPQSGP